MTKVAKTPTFLRGVKLGKPAEWVPKCEGMSPIVPMQSAIPVFPVRDRRRNVVSVGLQASERFARNLCQRLPKFPEPRPTWFYYPCFRVFLDGPDRCSVTARAHFGGS